MIENILRREELLGFARTQSNAHDYKTCKKRELESELEKGWEADRENSNSIRLKRLKKKADLLESRVWTLMYRMGFNYLSGQGGAFLTFNRDGENGPKSQIDVVALDDDIGVIISCKTVEQRKKEPLLPEKIALHASLRKPFSDSIRKQIKSPSKRYVANVMFVWDIVIRDSDWERANDHNVTLFDEEDLNYFEALVRQLGPAARFQLLCEIAKGKQIPGLNIKIPALKAKMGEFTCYSFSIRPDYLLKIAYVAHRSKGRAIDVDAYQRMVSRSRLKKIAEYIDDDGMFPTNIVINMEDARHIQFDRGKQEGGEAGAQFGWLTLSPSYGSAWIIDGQHRLYAYSGHNRAASSFVQVLAFEGLSESKQAQLFVDINSEQKKVKRSLLVELNAKLKWDADEDEKRASAIVSRVGTTLDEEEDSPLKDRVVLSDVPKTDFRCVSLTAIASALDKPGFFICTKKKSITEYGPLWRNDNQLTLIRTKKVLKVWLGTVADIASDWWSLGAAEGGGLAMSNGITICINVLRSVFEHLEKSYKLLTMDDDEVCNLIKPYAESLGRYYANLNANERATFRALQGITGQTTGTKDSLEAIHNACPQFDPQGLQDWIDLKKANTNRQAKDFVDGIEISLQDAVLEILYREFGKVDDQWWFKGVPKSIRSKIAQRIEDSDGKAVSKEKYFDFIHYREIIKENWNLFSNIFGFGKGNVSKDKRTEWIHEVNVVRSIVSHSSRREFVTFDQLNMLRDYAKWLKQKLEEKGFQTVIFLEGENKN